MKMIIQVHHAQISIPIGKEDEARAFYCGVLGFQEVPKPENLKSRGGFWMQLSNLQVHAGIENFDRTLTKAHLAYEVENLATTRALLVSKGLTPEDSISIPGYARFECRDPFGNRMEFLQRD
jgi:catechol 2,3-dioxygenase-like lactoylglutathione lyase family enzyme